MNDPANANPPWVPTFDQAHTKKLTELWDRIHPVNSMDRFRKEHRECREFAFFCAGIVDSLFHKLKTDCPQAVKGFKGFTIPE